MNTKKKFNGLKAAMVSRKPYFTVHDGTLYLEGFFASRDEARESVDSHDEDWSNIFDEETAQTIFNTLHIYLSQPTSDEYKPYFVLKDSDIYMVGLFNSHSHATEASKRFLGDDWAYMLDPDEATAWATVLQEAMPDFKPRPVPVEKPPTPTEVKYEWLVSKLSAVSDIHQHHLANDDTVTALKEAINNASNDGSEWVGLTDELDLSLYVNESGELAFDLYPVMDGNTNTTKAVLSDVKRS